MLHFIPPLTTVDSRQSAITTRRSRGSEITIEVEEKSEIGNEKPKYHRNVKRVHFLVILAVDICKSFGK